jgi:hypothetical protein
MPAFTARNLITLLATLLVCLAVLTAAGCGDDDDDDAANGGDATAEATDAPDATDGDGAEETDAPDATDGGDDGDGSGGDAEGACLLSEDEVAEATGEDNTATQFSGSEPLYSCQYTFGAVTSGLNLTVFFGDDVADAQALLDASDEEEPVEGLGDAAEWSDETTALSVLIGDMVLGVQFFGLEAQAQGALSAADAREVAIGIAESVIPRLPQG